MAADSKLDSQQTTEKILAKHSIDLTKDFYLKRDPILALEDMDGCWYPVRIEQWCGDTTCSFWKDGKQMIYPDRIKEFKNFQRVFARNIREQGWLEQGVKKV